MVVATKAAYQRAVKRSHDLGGTTRTVWMSGGRYRVKGTSGRYTVSTREWSCTCAAHSFGQPCWHLAAAAEAKMRDTSAGRIL